MFNLSIKTSGAAFRDESLIDRYGEPVLDPSGAEVCRILKDIICKLETGYTNGGIIDVNGNKVGHWYYR